MYSTEKEKLENLKSELLKLRKYMNYKNSSFCKKLLDKIIDKI